MIGPSKILPFVLLATLVSACSGGGSGAAPSAVLAPASVGVATGTLVIGVPAATSQSRTRSPEYVSAGTKYATLWIDNAIPGTRVACAPGTTSRSCSINWTSTSGQHQFTIATDDSPSINGGGNVLDDISVSETLNVGANTLAPIPLNGVAVAYEYLSESVETGTFNCGPIGGNCVQGYFAITDPDGVAINGLPGTFDGCPSSSVPANGQISCENNVSGIPSNGQIEFEASCLAPGATSAATNGNFAFTLPTPSTAYALTTQEIAEYSLLYPSKYFETTVFPSYSCANGVITPVGAANGTVTAT